MIRVGEDPAGRVADVAEGVEATPIGLDGLLPDLDRHRPLGGRILGNREPVRRDGRPRRALARARRRGSGWGGAGQVRQHERGDAGRRSRCGSARPARFAAYNRFMSASDGTLQSAMLPAESDRPVVAADPTAHLAAVYRDYPGLRALILRRVRDPELAADILQDAAVTTLEKLRSGEIAQPENVGGFLYRVALNHVRNHRRKDRTAVSSADGLESLAHPDGDLEWDRVGHPEWAVAARRVLGELPTARDRELLVRFYLNDEEKENICGALGLTEQHFNRVIFRARNRFRALLERRGFGRSDFLGLATLALALAAGASAPEQHRAASSELVPAPLQALAATSDRGGA